MRRGLLAVSNFSPTDLGMWGGVTALSYPYGYYTGASCSKPADQILRLRSPVQLRKGAICMYRHQWRASAAISAGGGDDWRNSWLHAGISELGRCCGEHIGCVRWEPCYTRAGHGNRRPRKQWDWLHAGRLMGFKSNDREADSTLAAKHD